MVAKEWLGAFWVQLVGSCSWTVILITWGSEPLTCVVGVVSITQTMKNLQKTRSHTCGKRKEYKMVDLRTKKGKRKCSLKIVKKEKLEMVLFLVLQVVSQFSCSVMLQPQRLKHTRLPRSPPTPGACSNSCTSSWWCHPTISSSAICFSSCLQSFPASGSFLMSQLFTLHGKKIGVSASASVFSMNIQDWFLLGWSSVISLQSKGFSRVFCNTTDQNHQLFSAQLSL